MGLRLGLNLVSYQNVASKKEGYKSFNSLVRQEIEETIKEKNKRPNCLSAIRHLSSAKNSSYVWL